METPLVIPPHLFGIVEPTLYRGAYPVLKNFGFLKRLNLQTVFSLIPEDPSEDLIEFCYDHGIRLVHLVVPKPDEERVVLNNSDVITILNGVLRRQNLPAYIHCIDGTQITSMVIACLRKLQNYGLSYVTPEFRRYSSDFYPPERRFLESFRGPITLGSHLPSWLWRGLSRAHHIHPTMKLIFEEATDSFRDDHVEITVIDQPSRLLQALDIIGVKTQ